MKLKKCLKCKEPNRQWILLKNIIDLNKQNQIEEGLKIVTPDQMLTRLPITLAKLRLETIHKTLKTR